MSKKRRRRRQRDQHGRVIGSSYHTMFGLPRSLKEFDERTVPEYDPEDGGIIRRQRELFAIKAAGVLLHGEPRGMVSFSAPGLGKIDTSIKISTNLCLLSTTVLSSPTAAGLKEYLADHRGPNSLVIIDDALRAMQNEALVTLLLDLLPVGGGPGIVRISKSEFPVRTRCIILGSDNPFDPTVQASNAHLPAVLRELELRIGKPMVWSFDVLECLNYVLWFARAGNIIQRWWPQATLKDANQILARFIETMPYRRDVSLRSLQLLTTHRKIYPNNWFNFDDQEIMVNGERKLIHVEPGLGKKKEPRKVPLEIWRRRRAYIFIPQRGATPPPDQSPQPHQQHWTEVVVTFGGHTHRYPMSEHGFAQLQLEYATMRHENRERSLESAVGSLAASLCDGVEPSFDDQVNLKLLAIAVHMAWVAPDVVARANLMSLTLIPRPPGGNGAGGKGASEPVVEVAEPVADQAAAQVEKPVVDQAMEPMEQPVAAQAAAQVEKPVVDQAAQPAEQPVAAQAAAQVEKPIVDQAMEPVEQPVVEQVEEDVAQPIVDQAAEPMKPPVVEQVTEQVEQHGAEQAKEVDLWYVPLDPDRITLSIYERDKIANENGLKKFRGPPAQDETEIESLRCEFFRRYAKLGRRIDKVEAMKADIHRSFWRSVKNRIPAHIASDDSPPDSPESAEADALEDPLDPTGPHDTDLPAVVEQELPTKPDESTQATSAQRQSPETGDGSKTQDPPWPSSQGRTPEPPPSSQDLFDTLALSGGKTLAGEQQSATSDDPALDPNVQTLVSSRERGNIVELRAVHAPDPDPLEPPANAATDDDRERATFLLNTPLPALGLQVAETGDEDFAQLIGEPASVESASLVRHMLFGAVAELARLRNVPKVRSELHNYLRSLRSTKFWLQHSNSNLSSVVQAADKQMRSQQRDRSE